MAAKGKPNIVVLAAVAVVHVTAVGLTWRDLRSRPAEQVRGPKKVWQVASALNTTGSVAYWLFGRRRHTDGHGPDQPAGKRGRPLSLGWCPGRLAYIVRQACGAPAPGAEREVR